MELPIITYPIRTSGILNPNDILNPTIRLGERVFNYSYFDISADADKLYESVVSFRKQLHYDPLVKHKLWHIGRIKHRGDDLYFEITDSSLYYDARSAAKRLLLWNTRRKEPDYSATLVWWRWLLSLRALDVTVFERIERNSLTDPVFEDFSTEITLERLSRTYSRDFHGGRAMLVRDALV